MTDANYIAIYDNDEVNFYDGNTVKIKVSEEAVLRGYKCPRTKLWIVPLSPNIIDETTDTLILDSPAGMNSLNTWYEVPSTNTITDTLNFIIHQAPKTTEAINNVYDLPSIEPTIQYLHEAAGFPTKHTWTKAIKAGNYLTRPFLTVKNVNKYFPESEETQQGHMWGQQQGVRSTKVKIKIEDNDNEKEGDEKQVEVKHHDIYIKFYDPK